MIGQSNIKKTLEQFRDNYRFLIIVGASGSGRKTLLHEVFKENAYWLDGISINSVRTMSQNAYKYSDTVFIIPDADKMSVQAKNALLKVVEECPNNNTFIMTLTDEFNTLETIHSRAVILYMDMYSSEELKEYMADKELTDEETDILLSVCETIGDIKLFMQYGVIPFYTYVQKVVDNITTVSGANAFKIANNISFKADDGKYDLQLFLKTFMIVCVKKFSQSDANRDSVLLYAKWCQITSKYIRELRLVGINKQFLFDAWLLDIRATVI